MRLSVSRFARGWAFKRVLIRGNVKTMTKSIKLSAAGAFAVLGFAAHSPADATTIGVDYGATASFQCN